MSNEYLLQIVYMERTIVRYFGSGLERTRQEALDLAKAYVSSRPAGTLAFEKSFQVIDEAGRLLLDLPTELVVSQARSSGTGDCSDMQYDSPG